LRPVFKKTRKKYPAETSRRAEELFVIGFKSKLKVSAGFYLFFANSMTPAILPLT
jgi:hypothetical protein